MNVALRVEGLNGGYNKAPVLRDVSFEVAAGEIVALFGANGAGKTTLLRALSGALPLCRGVIELGGRRIDRMPTWTRAQRGLAHGPDRRVRDARRPRRRRRGCRALPRRPLTVTGDEV